MSDEPVASCEVCGAPVERVFHPVAVHFKGSGFYTTDYARKGAKAPSDGSSEPSKDSKKSESKKDSGSGSGEKAKASSSSSGEKSD
jgi:hypothetical protein